MSARRIASEYSQIKPVSVTVCKRHRKELFSQRIMPGIIVFIILMIPILFILSTIFPFGKDSPFVLYGISVLIALFLMSRVVRLISLEGLVATALSIRDRRKGLNIEYLTEKKYQRITGGTNPGLIGLARSILAGRKAQNPAAPQPNRSKPVKKTRK
jgi:hypothetical protein